MNYSHMFPHLDILFFHVVGYTSTCVGQRVTNKTSTIYVWMRPALRQQQVSECFTEPRFSVLAVHFTGDAELG